MVFLDVYDALDRQIVTALQVNARASFRRIGDVLGTSDQTVARRYTRLRTEGRVRVLGLTNPERLGLTSWFVRARTTPDAAGPIAEALARRPDTAWVNITSGGTEIVCSLRTGGAGGADGLLLSKLPRTQRIVDVTAQTLLHVFYGLAESPLLKAGVLTPGQITALREDDVSSADVPPSGAVALDEVDRALLALLEADGRTPLDELASRTGAPATTVRRRLTALRAGGVLYFDVDFDTSGSTITGPTLMWLTVAPRDLDRVGEALAGHPEVAFAAATTGRTNVYASLIAGDAHSLYRYLTGPVAALPGVRDVETAPVIRAFKGAGAVNPIGAR